MPVFQRPVRTLGMYPIPAFIDGGGGRGGGGQPNKILYLNNHFFRSDQSPWFLHIILLAA